MEAEPNSRAQNNLTTKREDFDVVISPQTFQKYKSSMKRKSNGSKEADAQNSTANGSNQTHLGEEPYVLKVTAEDYDRLKKKYTKNKKFVRQKSGEQQPSRSKSKSPSSLKQRASLEDETKREKSTSPRNSGAGFKLNGKTSQTKCIEKTSTPSRNSLKPDNKPVSRKSYDVADVRAKPETGNKSRWSAGMVNIKNVDDDNFLGASSLKINQAPASSNKENSPSLDESSSVDVSVNLQEDKGRPKASRIPKSPNKLEANDHKKEKTNKRNSFEKVQQNKSPRCSSSKDHSPSDKKTVRGKNGKYPNDKKNASDTNGILDKVNTEHDKVVEQVTNQKKQQKISDKTQNNKGLANKLCDTQQSSTPKMEAGPIVIEESKNIKSNNCLEKNELQNCSYLKLDDFVGATTCGDTNNILPMDEKILPEHIEDRLITHVAKELGLVENVIDFPFVTKRIDMNLAPDALQPSADLDDCLSNERKCHDTLPKKDSNDNNFLTSYQVVPSTSKTIDVNLDQEHQQGNVLSVAIKGTKKTTPTARTPIMLKTPKRLKDGELMSEMLIYKLGSHSTPRKIRKNRNLDSLRKSDWGTPATDRITTTSLKRSISKKIKGKMFIKKTSKGILQPIPVSKLVPKNSPKREHPEKRVPADSGDETYKVTRVSDLIKKFENLEKEEESVSTQSKVAVTFKKSAILEKWQNGVKTLQQGLNELKEVKKKLPDADVPGKETQEPSIEIHFKKPNSTNEKEKSPTTNSDVINNNENFNNLTILNSDCIDSMSFVSLKFDQIYSDECADQTVKNNMRFSDLYKEINFQLTDSEKIEPNENKEDGNSNLEADASENNNLESPATSIPQDNDGHANADNQIIPNNNQGQEKMFEEGTDLLKHLEGDNSADDKNLKGEEQKIDREQETNQTTNNQAMDVFRGFEEVVVAEGRIDTTGEDRASPAYEVGAVDIKDEDFGEIYKQKLLSLGSQEDDGDDTSISSLLALSQKLSKQPTSYADYRKQFMEVKSRSLPPLHKINRCDTDDPKMSL
ncbi:uncharacterized protein LOC111058100 [Nilaparvata lugens]|uniref:uncharacterized protein LOC111058100 n=1 Tax=Nilaparvata lugens TaxID=108931 RepID=UPI00193E48B7|nr:uncharacterized protein LOC111058100 [Nilaparvata lugens]XP_039286896.1 uncharacterized protein LOC111058100 [Nilaparvata lugens]